MELPTCPACGQSVLDDEAKDCPFCGASMSGKPQARKPTAPAQPAKPTATEKSKSTTASAPPTSSEKQPAKKSPDKDDPFAVDPAAEKQKAVKLRSEPSQGRAHQVVCPMCETPGYTSTKAAGKNVYCCNPECLVPIFTAPELPKEEPKPEPVKRRGLFSLTGLGVSLLVLAVAAGGLWYFVFRPPELETLPGTFYQPKTAADTTSGDSTDPQSDTGTTGVAQSSVNDPQTPADIRAASLKAMTKASIQRDNNRSKAYCRRLTATAFANAGDPAEAQKQMDQLRALRPAIPHYLIEPLVKLAWQSIEAGDNAAAGKWVDQAVAVAANLPSRGESRLIFATELAAALVAINRMAEAQSLINDDPARSEEAQLAGQLAAMRSTSQFNADLFANDVPVNGWQAPQTAAVTIALVAHGKNEAAVRWVESQQDISVRSEAAAVWAEYAWQRALAQVQSPDMKAIDAAAVNLPAAGQANLYARVAALQLKSQSKAGADALLANARKAMAKTAPPAEFVLPEMKQLVNYQLPGAAEMRMNGLAAAELMKAEALAGNRQQAIAAGRLSMQFLRGTAPSPPAIAKQLNAIADEGAAAIQAELKRSLRLKSDNEARLAFNDYRKNCGMIDEAARSRFAVQQSVLAAAIDAGLLDFTLEEMTERAQHADLNQREPWATTPVAWQLRDQFELASNSKGVMEIQALLSAAAERRPAINRMVRSAETLISEGRFKEAMQQFNRSSGSDVSEEQRSEWRLRLAGRLVAEKKLDGAFEFVGAIDRSEAAFRDSALWYIAAQATQAGHARAVWENGDRASLSATEIVSIYAGLLETLKVPVPADTTAAN